MPPVAAIGGAALLGIGGSALAAREQKKGLQASAATQQRGIDAQSQFNQQLLALQREIFETGAPLRDIALERAQQQQGLSGDILERLRNPAEAQIDPAFDIASRKGLDLIGANAAVTGSPFSGPAQVARGEFQANLEASRAGALLNQQNFNLSNQMAFAGSAPSAFSGFTQGLPLSAQIGQGVGNIQQGLGGIAGTQAAGGAVNAGLFNSLGQTGAQTAFALGGGGSPGIFGNVGGGSSVPGFNLNQPTSLGGLTL